MSMRYSRWQRGAAITVEPTQSNDGQFLRQLERCWKEAAMSFQAIVRTVCMLAVLTTHHVMFVTMAYVLTATPTTL